ncbi:hypothetical protein ACA910_009034 [Epithemia clementina (nom. ined.)]
MTSSGIRRCSSPAARRVGDDDVIVGKGVRCDASTVATEDNSSSTFESPAAEEKNMAYLPIYLDGREALHRSNAHSDSENNHENSNNDDNDGDDNDDERGVYKTGERGCFLDFETQAAAIVRKRDKNKRPSSKLRERAAMFGGMGGSCRGLGGSVNNEPHPCNTHVVTAPSPISSSTSTLGPRTRPPLRRVNSTGSVDSGDEDVLLITSNEFERKPGRRTFGRANGGNDDEKISRRARTDSEKSEANETADAGLGTGNTQARSNKEPAPFVAPKKPSRSDGRASSSPQNHSDGRAQSSQDHSDGPARSSQYRSTDKGEDDESTEYSSYLYDTSTQGGSAHTTATSQCPTFYDEATADKKRERTRNLVYGKSRTPKDEYSEHSAKQMSTTTSTDEVSSQYHDASIPSGSGHTNATSHCPTFFNDDESAATSIRSYATFKSSKSTKSNGAASTRSRQTHQSSPKQVKKIMGADHSAEPHASPDQKRTTRVTRRVDQNESGEGEEQGGNDTEEEYEVGGGYRGTFMDVGAQQRAISRRREQKAREDSNRSLGSKVSSVRSLFEKNADSPCDLLVLGQSNSSRNLNYTSRHLADVNDGDRESVADVPASPSRFSPSRFSHLKFDEKEDTVMKLKEPMEAIVSGDEASGDEGRGGNDTEDEYEASGGYRGTFMNFEAQQKAISRTRARRRARKSDFRNKEASGAAPPATLIPSRKSSLEASKKAVEMPSKHDDDDDNDDGFYAENEEARAEARRRGSTGSTDGLYEHKTGSGYHSSDDEYGGMGYRGCLLDFHAQQRAIARNRAKDKNKQTESQRKLQERLAIFQHK